MANLQAGLSGVELIRRRSIIAHLPSLILSAALSHACELFAPSLTFSTHSREHQTGGIRRTGGQKIGDGKVDLRRRAVGINWFFENLLASICLKWKSHKMTPSEESRERGGPQVDLRRRWEGKTAAAAIMYVGGRAQMTSSVKRKGVGQKMTKGREVA